MELMHGTNGCVDLDCTTPQALVSFRKHIVSSNRYGILVAFLQRAEVNLNRNLNVFDNSLTSISTVVCRVDLYSEFIGFTVRYLKWTFTIEFSHAFDFSELDPISIFISMAFVFVYNANCLFILRNAGNNKLFGIFSSGIKHNVFVSIVDKAISTDSRSFCEDEATASFASGFVELHHLVDTTLVFSKDSDTVCCEIFRSERVDDVDCNVRVKLT